MDALADRLEGLKEVQLMLFKQLGGVGDTPGGPHLPQAGPSRSKNGYRGRVSSTDLMSRMTARAEKSSLGE